MGNLLMKSEWASMLDIHCRSVEPFDLLVERFER